MQRLDTGGNDRVPVAGADGATLSVLDEATRALVRLAAVVAAGSERAVRDALRGAVTIDAVWVEELLLQSYLFAGLPRTLNAMRDWRRVSGRAAPTSDDDASRDETATWRARGGETCAAVYGAHYRPLRRNIAELHPALDAWMIVEGYGKVLARPGLDLPRRELCVVAACAAMAQERQLHSHLHGALNVGVGADVVSAALEALDGVIDDDAADAARRLWKRVREHTRPSPQSAAQR